MKVQNDLFKILKIPNLIILVDTYWLFRTIMLDNYFNAHIMIRMLAIDEFYGKNSFGWKWYNMMQQERVKDNPLVPKYMANHQDEFIKLIKSFECHGYMLDHPIVLNKDLLLVDGAHRLALALYFGIERVSITFNEDYYNLKSRDYSFEWFKQHGLEYMIDEGLKKYSEIINKYDRKDVKK